MSITGLILRTGDTSINYGQSIVMTKRWEAYHPLAIVDSGTVSKRVSSLQKMDEADLELDNACQSRFSSVVAYHEPRGVIGGLSAFDADLVLDGWMQGSGLDHPILGHIEAEPRDLVKRVNTILDVHAPPPAWFWAEGDVGAIRVKCASVGGADSYNVYDGDELIGNVPNHNWNNVSVLNGGYSIRMAAVVDGTVGILSFPISVLVGSSDSSEVLLASMLNPTGPTRWQRFKNWWRQLWA